MKERKEPRVTGRARGLGGIHNQQVSIGDTTPIVPVLVRIALQRRLAGGYKHARFRYIESYENSDHRVESAVIHTLENGITFNCRRATAAPWHRRLEQLVEQRPFVAQPVPWNLRHSWPWP